MSTTKPAATAAKIVTVTVTLRRTWSVTDENTGMEIYRVTGKRRRDALLAHLATLGACDWWALRVAACEWAAQNPRRPANAA